MIKKDTAMKNFIIYLLVLTVSCMFFSCLKDKSNVVPPSLVGKWSIVNDSTTFSEWGLFTGAPTKSNYIGKAGDSYDFESNGNLYISDDGEKDTATYLTHLNLVRIGFTSYNGSSANPYPGIEMTVSNLTAHTVTLTDTAISPETIYTEKINLKR
jgi:hypothetical protein